MRNTNLLAARAAYVKQMVSRQSKKKTTEVVQDLADRLFLSPRTIWRDLKRNK